MNEVSESIGPTALLCKRCKCLQVLITMLCCHSAPVSQPTLDRSDSCCIFTLLSVNVLIFFNSHFTLGNWENARQGGQRLIKAASIERSIAALLLQADFSPQVGSCHWAQG